MQINGFITALLPAARGRKGYWGEGVSTRIAQESFPRPPELIQIKSNEITNFILDQFHFY